VNESVLSGSPHLSVPARADIFSVNLCVLCSDKIALASVTVPNNHREQPAKNLRRWKGKVDGKSFGWLLCTERLIAKT